MSIDAQAVEERYSGDDERIFFSLLADGQRREASISRSALTVLSGSRNDDLLRVFSDSREKIAGAAKAHLAANPLNKYILLGTNDF